MNCEPLWQEKSDARAACRKKPALEPLRPPAEGSGLQKSDTENCFGGSEMTCKKADLKD